MLLAIVLGSLACGGAAARSCRPAAGHRCGPAKRHPRSPSAERGRVAAVPRGRIFYVAPGGHDGSAGTSPRGAWRTVTRVDRAILRPGDTVLFRGGASFSDETLMPGEGFEASGTPGRPIQFGSYGRGAARLTRGVWLGTDAAHPEGPSWLTFRHLALGPVQGFQGTGDHIALIGLHIGGLLPPLAHQETGIQTEGSHWIIAGNTVQRTGGSGMLLGATADAPEDPAGGRFYLVSGNTITATGLDAGIGYPTHGIYLKVANARITHNRIVGFRDDGVSARYRDAVVSQNRIAGGQIGIAWYQYDATAGHSRFVDNLISNMSSAGIFVCGVAESCLPPIESFDIAGNRLRGISGMGMNLQPTTGRYLVRQGR
ncbi:MAG TPA: right-handed parallel beta-helix repeat-containing protein [Solirubrobacteraceae bacterium]|nr:right-handed parallel beta-helix repeat-containing protein [Solirubrobacteraceae bacterium]